MEDPAFGQLLILGLLMTIGFVAGVLSERVSVPRVAIYVVVGALFSPDLLGRVLPTQLGAWSDTLTDISLEIIAFIVGAELELRWFRTGGKTIAAGVLGQSLGTVLVIVLGMWAYSSLLLAESRALEKAIVLGAIGSATAPAATVAVIEEYRTKGPLTSTLLSIVAIDDALAIIYFTVAMGLVSASAQAGGAWMALWEIVGAILLGAALGTALGWYARRLKEDGQRLALVIGTVLLIMGIGRYLQVSVLLSCMVLGFSSKLLSHAKTEKWLHPTKAIQEVIFLVFFVLAGMHFQFTVFYGSWGFILAYILLRTVGKYGGALLGTRLGGAQPNVSRLAGLGLLPQAGVAIGLALSATETGAFADHASLILNTVLGSTIVFELVSPYLAKQALEKAGEAGRREQ